MVAAGLLPAREQRERDRGKAFGPARGAKMEIPVAGWLSLAPPFVLRPGNELTRVLHHVVFKRGYLDGTLTAAAAAAGTGAGESPTPDDNNADISPFLRRENVVILSSPFGEAPRNSGSRNG